MGVFYATPRYSAWYRRRSSPVELHLKLPPTLRTLLLTSPSQNNEELLVGPTGSFIQSLQSRYYLEESDT
jgi:hypothetical protein